MKDTVFSLAFAALLAAGIFWLMGGGVDTLQCGRWGDANDYPTNYYDTTLHPEW